MSRPNRSTRSLHGPHSGPGAARRRIAIPALLLCGYLAASLSASADETRMLDRFRDSARHFDAGATSARRDNPASAQESYERALAQDPSFVEAMVNLARVHLEAGRIETALDLLARAEQVRSDYPKIEATRGLIALRQGDDPRALDSLSRAYDLDPDDPEIATNLGAALIARGRIDEARRTLEKVVRREPDSAIAIYNLALANDTAGHSDLATYGYRRFLALSNFADPDRRAVEQRLEILSGPAAVSAAPDREVSLASEARSPHEETNIEGE